MRVKSSIIISIIATLLCSNTYALDAKTNALLNVNPVLGPEDPGYISKDFIDTGRVGMFSDISYKVFKPKKEIKQTAKKLPLVIMLHGCGQSGQSFVESTKIFKQAQRNNFLVLAPEQSRLRNYFGCWNFYRNHSRDGSVLGDQADILDIIKKVTKEYPVDTDKVYITGISAGAGLANNLVITNPHLFSGIAISASPSYGYNPDGKTLNWMMYNILGMDKDPSPQDPMMKPDASAPFTKKELEELTKEKFGMRSKGKRSKLKHVLIFHGENDPMVDASFLPVTEKQYINALSTVDTPAGNFSQHVVDEGTKLGHYYKKTQFKSGATVESFLIEGMWHSWGGGDGRTFTSPNHLDQTSLLLEKFDLDVTKKRIKKMSCIDLIKFFL